MIDVRRLYDSLLERYGRQFWWPAEDRFEIMAGALLVQRTNWRNVERALSQLKDADLLHPERLAGAECEAIERCVRCAGFYRSKASRLQSMARFVCDAGGLDALSARSTGALETDLLQLPGIGAETAAAIILYAFKRPVLVIDAYLRRLVQRTSGEEETPADCDIDMWFRAEFNDVPSLNELHALVVEHGKRVCLSAPRCAICCLRPHCRSAALN
jgi:endonuclease-3 related protein